jgi:hypothetical protein
MQTHDDIRAIVAGSQDIPPELRPLLLCRAASLSYSAIEREQGLTRGSISSYVGGRQYAFPKLRDAVTAHLAQATGRNDAELRQFLFPDHEEPR